LAGEIGATGGRGGEFENLHGERFFEKPVTHESRNYPNL